MARCCGFLFYLRLPQEVFYHSHLPRCEVAVALLVAQGYQGIMQTLGVSYFLSEASHGRYIAQVGIVTHGGTAEGHSSFSFHNNRTPPQILIGLSPNPSQERGMECTRR